jgi:hypothetical protein
MDKEWQQKRLNSIMKIKPNPIALVSAFILLLAGCFYDNEEALYLEVDLVPFNDTVPVTYQGDILPVLQTYCYECHSSAKASSKGGNIILEGYSNIKSAVSNGTLYGSISWDPAFVRMPYNSAKLPSSEIFRVKKWIDDGAPDN